MSDFTELFAKSKALIDNARSSMGVVVNAVTVYTSYLLGQEISVKQKTLKIRHFEDLSNGSTPRLHLLKVDYPINDESTLRYVGCFFEQTVEKMRSVLIAVD